MSLFGNPPAAGQSQPAGSLFGSTAQPQQTSLFGNTGGAASTTTPASQPPSNNLFGASTNQPAQVGGLFGSKSTTQPAATTGFGLSTTNNQNVQGSKSLFGGFGVGAASTEQSQSMPAAQPDINNYMMDSRRIWNEEDGAPRSRTVLEQLQMVNKKWDPANPQHSFQTYLYNTVDAETAAFYRPAPGENEEAWEDALRKAPNNRSVPTRVRGFYELGTRIVLQQRYLEILSGRLHEINNGLTALLRKHELDISSRTAAARRRHAALSQRVLTLATKTLVARNRGYSLEPIEEALRKRLGDLERDVTDPSISGREEEIWARMVQVREQGHKLEAAIEKAGLGRNGEKPQELSEEVVKQAEKVLKDYDKQLTHLTAELERIGKDWAEWEKSRVSTNGHTR